MRKAVAGGLAAAAVVVGAYVFAPIAWTQVRPAPVPRMALLDGRGSSIGVRIRDLERDDLAKAKLQQPGGVLIDDVNEDSPAAKAGLRRGDVVVEFDGERVRSARHFSRLVQETPDGRTVQAVVVRDGTRTSLEVTPTAGGEMHGRDIVMHMPDIERQVERGMRALPRHFAFDLDWDGAYPGARVWPRGRLGAQLAPLTDQLAEYFGAKDGVLVSSVDADSAAAKAGLKAGDVITTVNGRTVNDPGDVSEEIGDAEEAETIELGVVRDGKPMTIKAQLSDRPRATRRFTRPA